MTVQGRLKNRPEHFIFFQICAIPFLLSIMLSSAFGEALPVTVIRLSQTTSYQIERVYGGQLRARRMSNMGFETGGVIEQVNIEEGQKVEKGEALITLNQSALSAELEGAEAGVASAEATLQARQIELELSRSTLQRNQQLAASNHISEQLLDELSQQHRINESQLRVAETGYSSAVTLINRINVSLDKTVLKAPYKATIQSRFVNEGSIIGPGVTAVSLIEQDQLEAVIGVPESMVHLLELGADYEFVINNRQVNGSLKSLLPEVDPARGTITAIFAIEAQNLFVGALAEVRLSATVDEPGFWVPLTALTESQRGLWTVFSAEALDGLYTVQPQLIEIIYQGKDSVYVRGSIKEGNLIVDSGIRRVVPGQQIDVIIQSSFTSAGFSNSKK